MINHSPLVRLWDMLEIYAREFLTLGQLMQHMQFVPDEPDGPVPPDEQTFIVDLVSSLSKTCTSLGMRVSAGLMARRQADYEKSAPAPRKIQTDFKYFSECLREEFDQRWLLYLSGESAELYRHGPRPFGDMVAERFPLAAYDIREACKCLALERHTATVYHLMRVAEKGLEALAGKLGVPFELEQWHVVIEGIESKVKDLKGLPRGPEKLEKQQVYSEAATDLRHFKDAWRNHATHGRGQYDEEDAKKVMTHVKSFMQHLAEHLPE